MYCKYDPKNAIHVEEPYRRTITPILMGDDTDVPLDFSIHMTEWDPGSQVDDHAHDNETEVMYCLSGRGIALVDGEEHELVPHSLIAAPPGVRHCIKNTGTELLRVLCVFSPASTGEKLRSRAQTSIDEWKKQNENNVSKI